MNSDLQSILSIFVNKLPTISAMIPLPYAGIAGGIIAAIGQHFLNKPDATVTEVAAAVKADPAGAVEALKPLDDHLATVVDTAGTGASTVPQGALPTATETVKEAVIFATNDLDVTVSPVDRDGGRYLSKWYSRAQWAQLVDATCVMAGPTGSKA